MAEDALQAAVRLFEGRVVPEWYVKVPEGDWEDQRGCERYDWSAVDGAKRYWLEKAAELLVQPKPDKGLMRTAIIGVGRVNRDLEGKLKDKLRRLR